MGLVATRFYRYCVVRLSGGAAKRKNFLDWLSFRGGVVLTFNGVDVVSHSAWLPSCNPDFLRDAWHRQFHSNKNLD